MLSVSREIVSVFVLRAGLVALFVPFSAYYMLANFRAAQAPAASAGVGTATAASMTIGAIILKVMASFGMVTGIADRLSAVLLASFCITTALVYKKFWTGDGFHFAVHNANLPVFWDFMKNVSLAAGFVLIGFGADAENFRQGMQELLENPFASSKPYSHEALDT